MITCRGPEHRMSGWCVRTARHGKHSAQSIARLTGTLSEFQNLSGVQGRGFHGNNVKCRQYAALLECFCYPR